MAARAASRIFSYQIIVLCNVQLLLACLLSLRSQVSDAAFFSKFLLLLLILEAAAVRLHPIRRYLCEQEVPLELQDWHYIVASARSSRIESRTRRPERAAHSTCDLFALAAFT